jgi:uncharacterized protein (DUF2132 family)
VLNQWPIEFLLTEYMNTPQPNNPLHGVTLEHIVEQLVNHYGWNKLAQRVNINCFKSDPSVKSSLKFLRRTPWARAEVEALYLATFAKDSH